MAIIMTMLLVIASASGIYAAADSRRFPAGDTTQKIFTVGNDAVIMQGGFALIPGAGDNGNNWDAVVEFQKTAATITDEEPERQFDLLRTRVFDNFSNAISRFRGEISNGKSLDFFFVRRLQAKNYGWFQKISVDEVQSRTYQAKIENPITFETGVYWSLPPECSMQNFDFKEGASFGSISELFHRVASQSVSCSHQIGGPIRIAIIDDGGVRWLDPSKR
jgi:hypothetical protein